MNRKWVHALRVCQVLFVLMTMASSALTHSIDAGSEAAARLVIEQSFGAYSRASAEEVLSFWSLTSPERAAAEKRLKDLFAAHEKFRLGRVAFVKFTPDGPDRVTVRADIELSAVDKKTGKESASLGSMHRTIALVREADTWKIWRDVASEEDLADALVAMETNEKRTELLAANRELMTVDLRKFLLTRANNLRNEGKYDRAVAICNFVIDAAGTIGDQAGVGWALVSIGSAYRSQGQYEAAIGAFEKSISVFEKLSERNAHANAITLLGGVYLYQGNYDRALAAYRKALSIAEESGHRGAVADATNSIGHVYIERGDVAGALAQYERSLQLRQEADDRSGIAWSFHSIARVYVVQGAYDLAIEYYQKALVAAEKAEDKATITSSVLNNMGVTNIYRGNYGQAMEHYQRVLQLNESLGDQRIAGSALFNIALIHSTQGNYDTAMTFARRSLELKQKMGAKTGITRSVSLIAEIYRRDGQTELALEWFEKAKAHAEEVGDKTDMAEVLIGMGYLYWGLADYERANRYHHESLALYESLGDKTGIGWTLVGIAIVHLDKGEFEKALLFADRGVELARARGNLNEIWYARTIAGRALHGLGRTAEARTALDEAINTIETMRTQLAASEQDEERFFEGKVPSYHALIDLLVDQGSHAEAFQYAERAKARVLLDTLQRGKTNVTKAMTAEERGRERTLRGQIVSINNRIAVEKGRDPRDATRLSVLNLELTEARTGYELFQNRLYALHPELRVKRGDIPPLTLEEVSELLPNAGSALLEYVLTRKHSYLFVLARGFASAPQLSVVDLSIEPVELRKRVDDFRARIARRDLDFRNSAREMFDLLIAPAQKHLAGKTTLILVPDGVLWELPFQALVTPGQRFVVEQFAISYAPSGTTLREMLRGASSEEKTSRSGVLLAFGNPAVSNATATHARAVLMSETLDPLPEAEKQVKALAKSYGANRSRVYVGADAREERLKNEAKGFRILQLATHGILNDASPMYSHVVLAQSKEAGEEDGLLEAWEMMNLDLNADLVVLSACETARGRIGAGEGVVGMSWALFVAGAPSLVVSQWKVDSASTTELMLEFHRNLQRQLAGKRGSPSKARAMQLASMRLLKSERYRHPFYWAGFVVVGDPR